MKRISVIIPVFNAARFLRATIDSVLQQNYNDLEVILIDDGSTDSSKQIIKEYQEKNSKIHLICQDNLGAPSARNVGISKAKGDYVLFLDADDTLCEGALDNLEDILDDNVDLVVGNFNKIDEKGNFLCHVKLCDKDYLVDEKDILEHSMLDPKPGCKIYNLSIIKNVGLYFDCVKIGQDLNFYLKYISLIKNIKFINKALYNYRIVSNGISRSYTLKILDIENSFKYVKEFYKKQKRINDYEMYIVWSEYFNYYFQYCKMRFFDDKKERKDIYNFFKKRIKTLKLNYKSIIFKKNKKIFFISKIRFALGPLYITNSFCYFFKKIRGNKHI